MKEHAHSSTILRTQTQSQVPKPLSLYDQLRASIAPELESSGTTNQYNSVSTKRAPVEEDYSSINSGFENRYNNNVRRQGTQPDPGPSKLMCTRRDDYYVDFVQDVGQFRPDSNESSSRNNGNSVRTGLFWNKDTPNPKNYEWAAKSNVIIYEINMLQSQSCFRLHVLCVIRRILWVAYLWLG